MPTSLPATCSVKCLNVRHLSVDVATIDGLCCRVPPPYRVPARPEGDAEPSQAPFLLPHFLPSPSRSLPPLPAARGEAAMAGRPAGTAPSHLRSLPLVAPSWPPWPFPLAAEATPQPAESLAGRPRSRCRRRGCRGRRWLTWPGRVGRPRSKRRPPTSAQGPPGAPPPLSRRRHGLLRPKQRDPGDLPVQSYVEDPVLEFDKVKGPNCEVSDSSE